MVKYTQGNLLIADVEAIVNTVNCVGVMGKGLALQFKKKFPDNFRQYKQACHTGQVKPGKMFIVPTNRLLNPRYLINFPTKRHWRNKSRLTDIQIGLQALVEEVKRLNIHSIAIPALGCGNGGLAWSDVAPVIVSAFEDLSNVDVLLFEPKNFANTKPIVAQKPPLTEARALLILLMDEYQSYGYKMGLLEVQKLAYFLQAAGEPLRLRYVKQKYGPYAHNLNPVLRLLDGHLIRGYDDDMQKANIHLLPEAANEARAFLANAPEAIARLEKVVCLIEGFETPYGLELLAIVHWVAQEAPQIAVDSQQLIKRVHGWDKPQKELFKPKHICAAWQQWRDAEWLPIPTMSISHRSRE